MIEYNIPYIMQLAIYLAVSGSLFLWIYWMINVSPKEIRRVHGKLLAYLMLIPLFLIMVFFEVFFWILEKCGWKPDNCNPF